MYVTAVDNVPSTSTMKGGDGGCAQLLWRILLVPKHSGRVQLLQSVGDDDEIEVSI